MAMMGRTQNTKPECVTAQRTSDPPPQPSRRPTLPSFDRNFSHDLTASFSPSPVRWAPSAPFVPSPSLPSPAPSLPPFFPSAKWFPFPFPDQASFTSLLLREKDPVPSGLSWNVCCQLVNRLDRPCVLCSSQILYYPYQHGVNSKL